MKNKFLLVLNGPMCAGKSTLTKLFMENEQVFKGSYDTVKWLIGGYSADNQNHRESAKEITFHMIRTAMDQEFSIVIDGGFGDFRTQYKKLAKENDFLYFSVNIEAPLEILEKRFLERVGSAKIKGNNISVTTLEGFYSRYEWYQEKNKDLEGITIDSSQQSPKEIYHKIMELLKNNIL